MTSPYAKDAKKFCRKLAKLGRALDRYYDSDNGLQTQEAWGKVIRRNEKASAYLLGHDTETDDINPERLDALYRSAACDPDRFGHAGFMDFFDELLAANIGNDFPGVGEHTVGLALSAAGITLSGVEVAGSFISADALIKSVAQVLMVPENRVLVGTTPVSVLAWTDSITELEQGINVTDDPWVPVSGEAREEPSLCVFWVCVDCESESQQERVLDMAADMPLLQNLGGPRAEIELPFTMDGATRKAGVLPLAIGFPLAVMTSFSFAREFGDIVEKIKALEAAGVARSELIAELRVLCTLVDGVREYVCVTELRLKENDALLCLVNAPFEVAPTLVQPVWAEAMRTFGVACVTSVFTIEEEGAAS